MRSGWRADRVERGGGAVHPGRAHPGGAGPDTVERVAGDEPDLPDRHGQPPGRVPVHDGRRLEHADLIDADPLAEEVPQAAVIKAVRDHGGGPVGKHRELVPQAGQRPQRGDGVRERLQVVIEPDQPLGLPVRQARPEGGEGEVKRAGRHPAEVLVTAHRREPERVLQLLQPPEPGRLAAVGVAENPTELAGDGDRVNQRPVQVERQDLATSRRASRVIRRASHW